MKLFQIEEPDGLPVDPAAPGASIGIDASGQVTEVAFSIGGNAVMLRDRDGFERVLAVPEPDGDWQGLFEGARLRAERTLARPVTHAVVVLATEPDASLVAKLLHAAEAAGLTVLHFTTADEVLSEEPAAETAATLAEDIAPRPAGTIDTAP